MVKVFNGRFFITNLPDLSCMTMMKIAFSESVNRASKCTNCGKLNSQERY